VPLPLETASVADNATRHALETIAAASLDLRGVLARGSGDPNGVVMGSPGALYLNRAGGAGTTLYVKESGVNTNTGWVGK